MSFKNTTLASFCSPSRAYNVTVFSANPNGHKRGIRRKLTAKDRAKVHSVRRTGACLSCRMLKVPCDIPDPENPGPCKRCLAIASRPQQKGLLAFRECIRTKLRDVNVFQHTLGVDFTSLNSPKLKSLLSKTVDPIEPGTPLSLPEILSSIFTWMVPENGINPERSIVGALICSEEFRQLHKNDGFLGANLLEKFRVMIYSSTLAYVYDCGSREVYDSDLTMRDLHRITHAMGSDLLLYLDNVLVPHQLAKMSQAQLSSLFVVIFGIALAVAYSSVVYESPAFDAGSGTGGQTPKTLWQALQQHLSQMLAHHLIILGARLGLVLRGDSEKEVLSSLMSGIIRRGNFVWVAQQRAVKLPVQNNTGPPALTRSELTETTENTEELFVLNIPEADVKSDPTTGALGLKELDSYRSTPVSVRSLQTIQNSLRAIITNEGDEDRDVIPAERRRFANKRASRAFRSRKRKLEKEMSSGVSTTAQLSQVAKKATSTTMTMSGSSTTSGTGLERPNNDISSTSATSTTPASPFQQLSTDLNLDMDLDADPFGIGWLPDPEPQKDRAAESPELKSQKDHSPASLIQQLPPTTRPDPGNDVDQPREIASSTTNNNNHTQSAPSFWVPNEEVSSPSIWGCQITGISEPLQPLENTTSPLSSTGNSVPEIWGAQGAEYRAASSYNFSSNLPSQPKRATYPSNVSADHTAAIWGCQFWDPVPPPRRPTNKASPSPFSEPHMPQSPTPPALQDSGGNSSGSRAATWACQQGALPPRRESLQSNNSSTTSVGPSIWGSQLPVYPIPPPPSPRTNSRADTQTTKSSNFASKPARPVWATQHMWESQPSEYSSWGRPPTTSINSQAMVSNSHATPSIQQNNAGIASYNGSSNATDTKSDANRRWQAGGELGPEIWACQSPYRHQPRQAQYQYQYQYQARSRSPSQPLSEPQYSYPPPPSPPLPEANIPTTAPEKDVNSKWWKKRDRKRVEERFVHSFQRPRASTSSIKRPLNSGHENDSGDEENSAGYSNSSYFGPVKKRPVI